MLCILRAPGQIRGLNFKGSCGSPSYKPHKTFFAMLINKKFFPSVPNFMTAGRELDLSVSEICSILEEEGTQYKKSAKKADLVSLMSPEAVIRNTRPKKVNRDKMSDFARKIAADSLDLDPGCPSLAPDIVERLENIRELHLDRALKDCASLYEIEEATEWVKVGDKDLGLGAYFGLNRVMKGAAVVPVVEYKPELFLKRVEEFSSDPDSLEADLIYSFSGRIAETLLAAPGSDNLYMILYYPGFQGLILSEIDVDKVSELRENALINLSWVLNRVSFLENLYNSREHDIYV